MRDSSERPSIRSLEDAALDTIVGGRTPAYGLPSDAVQSGFKSTSTPGGGTNDVISTTQTITFTGLE
jgi:hypothetical protein